jgi:hypothetical protein
MAIDKQTQKLLLYTAIGGGAYFLILKPLLIKLGILKSALELEQDYTQKVNIDAYINNSIKTQTPTKSKGEWQIIADQIYNDLKFSGIADNKSDAGYQVARVQNDADIATLIQVFGMRQESFFGINIGGLQNLPQFIIGNLDKSEIAKINDNYARKNIKFRF